MLNRISGKEIIELSRTLSMLLFSRVPVSNSIEILLKQTRNIKLKEYLRGILKDIKAGSSISKSFSKYPELFSEIFIANLRIAEETGQIAEVLSEYTDYLEKVQNLKRKIIQAIRYPVLVLIVAGLVMFFMLFFIIPTFQGLFISVKAPLHLFCRLEDRQTGDSWNVETTNGGNPARNQWYIDEMNISQTAINSGLYLKDLTKKEYIAELIGPLIHKYRREGKFEKALKYADLLLKLSPESDVGLVQKGALLDEIGYQKLKDGTLTEKEKKYYHDEAEKYINKAFALGWKPESKEKRKEYLKSVKTELQKTKSEEK